MAESQNSTTSGKPGLDERQFEFEKYKARIELFKWLIGSVALVLVTMVIDYGFRDRAAGLQEIQQYDKYVTELIILNKEPGQKRMLAQFFAYVTPSEKLKKGWLDYYIEVDKEYQKFIGPVLKNDSIIKEKYNAIIENLDGSSEGQTAQLQVLKTQIENNRRAINPDIILPSTSGDKDYNSAIDWEAKGFSFLLAKDVNNAILAFRSCENAYNGFHQANEISKYLNDNKTRLQDANSGFWKTAFKKIADDYSWKMPVDVREKLLANSN